MKRVLSIVIALSIFLTILGGYFCFAHPNNNPVRIGYVESESFYGYASELAAMSIAFQEFGVIESYDVDINDADSAKVWKEICKHNKSSKYEFVENMYFNMNKMDKSEYSKMVNRNDVDLIIVMGTVAGEYFLKNEDKNNFMVLVSSDPISAGIVKSETERYKSNSYAHIDRTRYKRQIQAAYRFLNFKRIGVVYEDTDAAYVYSAIGQLKDASKELGFDIAIKHVKEAKNNDDYDRYYKDLKQAYKELAYEGIDALYITTATIQDEKLMSLLEPEVYKNNIPTIAQTGESQVEYGALFGVTIQDTMEQGYFEASQIKAYVEEGVEFDKLEQVNEGTPKIYLNFDIAKKIGLKIPFSLLLIVDTIYKSK